MALRVLHTTGMRLSIWWETRCLRLQHTAETQGYPARLRQVLGGVCLALPPQSPGEVLSRTPIDSGRGIGDRQGRIEQEQLVS